MNLHSSGNVGKTGPVRPVDPTVLHVVHRLTVDHHSRVSLVESTDVDPGVTKSTPLLGRVDRRSEVENLGKLLGSQVLLNVYSPDGRNGHRGLPVLGNVDRSCDHDFLESIGTLCKRDDAYVAASAVGQGVIVIT